MSTKGPVIFVDDEQHVRRAAEQTLELAGYDVQSFDRAEQALTRISRAWPGVLVTDVKMPRMDGLTLLRRAIEVDSQVPVVLVTGHGDVSMAVQAMRDGAYDFIEKPFPAELLVDVVRRAMEKRALVLENRALRSELDGREGPESMIIGKTVVVERLRRAIASIADTDADVLIFGETGTGKELVARCLHESSRRREKPFVAINCGAVPETIIENELFGHEPGAFTGANQRRVGKFEHSSGGTFFLDEIESMPPFLQVKLLRVLQERVIERLGSNESVNLDLRVIAATKKDLREACNEGEFREDLYYRLNVATLVIPPLRERREDIGLLFQHFLMKSCARYGREIPMVQSETLRELIAHTWPGNVRELQNVAERLVLGLDQQFAFGLMDGAEVPQPERNLTLPEQVECFEKCVIEQELLHQLGNIKATYEALGLPRKTLYDKMRKFGLNRSDYISGRQ
jgi:two-component system, NtrC family, C4-dicarboxylate transport response regulator DctD